MEANRLTNININFILEKHQGRQKLHTKRNKTKPCKYTNYDIIL